jgi:hypothetical protein
MQGLQFKHLFKQAGGSDPIIFLSFKLLFLSITIDPPAKAYTHLSLYKGKYIHKKKDKDNFTKLYPY